MRGRMGARLDQLRKQEMVRDKKILWDFTYCEHPDGVDCQLIKLAETHDCRL